MSDADGRQATDDGGVRTITIDRPESKNAFSFAMRARMCELLAEAFAGRLRGQGRRGAEVH